VVAEAVMATAMAKVGSADNTNIKLVIYLLCKSACQATDTATPQQ
jgi:hypothetical protein